jgi:hypothetical protein
MNQHLSSQQVSMWMAGERAPEQEQHVRECRQCAAELARFQATLSLFRDSVRRWSDQHDGSEAGSVFEVGPAPSRFRTWPARWAVAAAVLLVVAAVPIYRSTRHSQSGVTMAQADALLLEQVDAEVSRAVPRPMEPLLKLVSWDAASGNGAGDGQSNAGRKENHETTQQH